MRTSDIKILYFYEQPTLLTCAYEKRKFVFSLLDEEKGQYIGTKLTREHEDAFLSGRIDLLTIMKANNVFYLGKYDSSTDFYFSEYRGEMTEDHYPAEGLIIVQ
jgi:hypothetical protein